jgi:hypothetical protein
MLQFCSCVVRDAADGGPHHDEVLRMASRYDPHLEERRKRVSKDATAAIQLSGIE